MNKTQTPEDIAGKRLLLITPLLEEGLDNSRIIELKKKLSANHNISYRTISRYHQSYINEGFVGLKPQQSYHRKDNKLPPNFPEILEQAIILRRECPTRSVTDIIRILEMEELFEAGSIHRSTLQRHLQTAGFGAKQVRMYTKKGIASRRFAKEHRMQLLQGDYSDILVIPIFA